jgi:hypothetical protein
MNSLLRNRIFLVAPNYFLCLLGVRLLLTQHSKRSGRYEPKAQELEIKWGIRWLDITDGLKMLKRRRRSEAKPDT